MTMSVVVLPFRQ